MCHYKGNGIGIKINVSQHSCVVGSIASSTDQISTLTSVFHFYVFNHLKLHYMDKDRTGEKWHSDIKSNYYFCSMGHLCFIVFPNVLITCESMWLIQADFIRPQKINFTYNFQIYNIGIYFNIVFNKEFFLENVFFIYCAISHVVEHIKMQKKSYFLYHSLERLHQV